MTAFASSNLAMTAFAQRAGLWGASSLASALNKSDNCLGLIGEPEFWDLGDLGLGDLGVRRWSGD